MATPLTLAEKQNTAMPRGVTVTRMAHASFGFNIRGGAEMGAGIFVSAVMPNSPSAHAVLQVGDQVTEVAVHLCHRDSLIVDHFMQRRFL
jgi:S1-C subfamily serine protease